MAGADRGGTLPRHELVPWPGLNPRRRFPEEELLELRASIEQDGIIEPLVVRLHEEPPHFILAGERRWRAAEGILEDIPVVYRNIDEATALRLALLENMQRSDLNPIEEARGMARYLEHSGITQTLLAHELGKTQGWVSNRLRLLRLPEQILELVEAGFMTQSQARDLILPFTTLTDDQWELLSAAVAGRLQKEAAESEGSFTDKQIRTVVSGVAIAMSGWLDDAIWGEEDRSSGFDLYTRVEEEYWKTAPAGSIVTYEYGYRKSSRCFDEAWWTKAMQAAEKRDKARRAAEQREWDKERKSRPTSGGAVKWKPADGVLTKALDYQQQRVVYDLGEQSRYYRRDPLELFTPLDEKGEELTGKVYELKWRVFVDPGPIPAEKLIQWKPKDAKSVMVVCTSPKAFDEARASLEREQEQLVRQRLRVQAEADLEAAGRLTLAKVLPELVALASLDTSFEDLEPWYESVADELGIALPALDKGARYGPGSDEGYVTRVTWAAREQLRAVPAAAVERIAQLAVYRLASKGKKGSGLLTRANIERSVAFQLRMKYQRELEAKVLFELPTHDEPKPKKTAKARRK